MFCSSTAGTALAGLMMTNKVPNYAKTAFAASAVFEISLAYFAWRFAPQWAAPLLPHALQRNLDIFFTTASIASLVAMTNFAIALIITKSNFAAVWRYSFAIGVLSGSFGLVLLLSYPIHVVIGGPQWLECLAEEYPSQRLAFSSYIYVPAATALAAIMFGATLLIRKAVPKSVFCALFLIITPLTVGVTVLSQEIHLPFVSTQRLLLPCPALPEGKMVALQRLSDVLDLSHHAQTILSQWGWFP